MVCQHRQHPRFTRPLPTTFANLRLQGPTNFQSQEMSCVESGVMCCTLPTCVPGLAKLPPEEEAEETKLGILWMAVLLLFGEHA